MKLFKKTAMSLALGVAVTSGALMMGVSAPVQAVNIAQNGLGQVLIFPYYTTRNGWASYFNITNTSNKTVLIKVRWREGMNSRDARDFNVVLSPYDVWTAAVGSGGKDGAAKITTSDNSCTAPQLSIVKDNAPAGRSADDLTGVDFTNLAYINYRGRDNRDKGPESKDRTSEGYFEVIEMGVAKSEKNTAIAVYSKHEAGKKNNKAMPKDCARVARMFTPSNLDALRKDINPPQNVLKGRAVLINVAQGVAAGYDPLVLANFNNRENMVWDPSSPFPNLNDAKPPRSITVDDSNILTNTVKNHVRGVDAVSQLILRNGVINDYNIATESKTDWILTFPTKSFYVDKAWSGTSDFASLKTGVAPLYPFDNSVGGERFSGVQDGKSCFDVTVSMWDREEYRTRIEDGVQFSPREPGEEGDRMCYEANVLSFGDSNMFKSKLSKSFFKDDPTQLPGESGWARVSFGAKGASLPVVGMRVEMRNRGSARANFGFANDHAYTQSGAEVGVIPSSSGGSK